MHKHFPDWYQEVNLDATDALLKKRQTGILASVSSITPEGIIELVRLLFSHNMQDEDWLETFCKHIRNADSSFPMRNNEAELRILAGATIAEIIKKHSNYNTLAALAIQSISFTPFTHIPPRDDIIQEAKDFLLKESAQLREHPEAAKFSSPKLGLVALNKELTNIKFNIPETGAEQGKVIIDTLSKISEAVLKLSQTVGSQYDTLKSVFDIISEESNILWWLFGGVSRDMDTKMCDLEPTAACLVVGKELADLVKTNPGPLSARAILDQMLHLTKDNIPDEIPLKSVVDDSPRKWREDWFHKLNIESVPTICPLHFAVQSSLQTNSKNKWSPVFNKQITKGTTMKFSPLDYSEQVYRESLLLKLYHNNLH